MPYVTGDVVRIGVLQRVQGVNARNVFHYEITQTDGNATADELLAAFQNAVVAPLAAIQSTSVEYRTLTVDNLTDGLSFGERALFSVEGNVGGPPHPTTVAFGFRLLRGSKLTRSGFKRFVGVVEDQTGGNVYQPAFLSGVELSAVIDALGQPVVSGAPGVDLSMRPVIVGKNRPTPLGFVFQPVVGVEFQDIVTTQVSRKPGRGE